MILLDTVVLSELRKKHSSPNVVAWLQGCAAQDLFISVVSIGEIERGICKVADAAFARALERWLEDLLRLHRGPSFRSRPPSCGAGANCPRAWAMTAQAC